MTKYREIIRLASLNLSKQTSRLAAVYLRKRSIRF